MGTHTRIISTLALCAGTSAHGLAFASADEARTIGRAALERFVNGDFQGAFHGFERAEQRAHSPVFGLYMARCQASLGSLRRARRLYEQVIADALPARAPGPWRSAQDEARAELAALLPRVPSIVIVGASRAMRIRVDGVELGERELADVIDLDPGAHVVEVTGARGVTTHTLDLPEGLQRRVVDVREHATAPSPTAPAPARQTTQRLVQRAVTPAPEAADPARFLVPLAMGGAMVVAGTVFGVVAATQFADVRSRCEGVHCLRSDQGKADVARRWAALSTAAFAAGASGLAVGGILYWTRPNPTSETPFVGVQLTGSL